MGIDLGREDLEEWRKRQEVLSQSNESSSSTSLGELYSGVMIREVIRLKNDITHLARKEARMQ